MDSTSQTTAKHLVITNELLSRVTDEFASQTDPTDSEIIKELLLQVTHRFDSTNSP